MALFRSLAHRSFALLWSGQTISRLGDSLYQVALAWWVLEKTGSATTMGLVLIFSFAPMLLFLLIGGVLVDRFSRFKVMLASDLLRGVIVTAVALLATRNLLEVWHVCIASLVFGLVDAFFQPAYSAAVPEITPRELLPSANSLTGLSQQVSGVVGPLLGAYLVEWGGTSSAFLLDGLSFFISAACLVPLATLSAPRPSGAGASSSMMRDLRQGISFVLGSPWLWITIVLAALSNITRGGPTQVALPFLIQDHLHADVSALGQFRSMVFLGAVIGSMWLGRLSKIRRRGRLAYAAMVMAGLTALVIGLQIPLVAVLFTAVVMGASVTIFNLIWTNQLQEMVPQDMLGRVSSIDYLGSLVFVPIGFGITGWVTDQIGAATTFVIGGALTALVWVLGLLHPAIRNLD